MAADGHMTKRFASYGNESYKLRLPYHLQLYLIVVTHMEDAPVHSIMAATIPKGSTVLVTGVTGFIASHVADQLLQAGYITHHSLVVELS